MTDNWQNRGGIPQQFAKLPPMDLNAEHEFELIDVNTKDNVPDIYNPGKTVNKIITVWKESGKQTEFHKIYAEFNEYYSEKASLMKFLCKVSGKPFVVGTPVKLGEWLYIGMKIKARVLAKYNKDTGEPTGNYKFAESIKPGGSLTISQNASPAVTPSEKVAKAISFAKGAVNAGDAFGLMVGKVSQDYIQEFIAADKRGEIKYPIQ